MKNFPKYFNSKADYLNMLAGWPPLYLRVNPTIPQLSPAAAMSAALEALENTAARTVPVWPEGYDPDNPDPQSEPVQPESWTQEPDPNGTVYRIGLNPETVAALREIVTDFDPIILQAHAWIGKVDDGEFDTILSEAAATAEALDDLSVVVSPPVIQPIIDAATILVQGQQSETDLKTEIGRFINSCLLERTAFLTGV